MASIHIERDHQLEPSQLRSLVEEVALSLEQEYQLNYRFDGDDIHFRRSGAKGQLLALSDRVVISIKLSFLLTPLSATIHQAIEQRLDQLLD